MMDGESSVTITITINDDDVPEPDQHFYFVLYQATGGDAVVDASRSYAQLTILANDDPNGVFAFLSPMLYTNELSTINPVALTITRSRGLFGVAAVFWTVVNSASRSNDVSPLSGSVSFADGQSLKVRACARTHTHTHTHTHARTHTRTHAHTRTRTCTHTHTSTHKHTPCSLTHARTHVLTHSLTHRNHHHRRSFRRL
jgi:hypothetical protein